MNTVQMYSKQRFWQVFHTIPYLYSTYPSTLYTNYRAKGKSCTHFICCIATYPVGKIIRSLNNWGLEFTEPSFTRGKRTKESSVKSCVEPVQRYAIKKFNFEEVIVCVGNRKCPLIIISLMKGQGCTSATVQPSGGKSSL